MVNDKFKARQCYLEINGHHMPMLIENISDESEYSVSDRQFYSQSYSITLQAYIIRREDYKVERIPSRLVMSSHDSDASGIVNRRGKNRRDDEKVKFIEVKSDKFKLDGLKDDERCIIPIPEEVERPVEIYEPTDDADNCCIPDNGRYYNKIMKVIMSFDCESELAFVIDKEMIADHIETDNVYDFRIIINGEVIDLMQGYKFQQNDEIMVRITKDDVEKPSEFTIVGYDPNEAVDRENLPESSLDEKADEEHILINPKE
jgi:hypothetical protein